MKKSNCIFLFSVIILIFNLQVFSQEVISSAGDYYKNGDYALSWTVGEPVIETFKSNSVTLTQGFQQPCFCTMQILNIPSGWSGISCYMNPTNPELENMFNFPEFIILKNLEGYYWPPVNTLGDWDTHKGYMIKVSEAVPVSIAGTRENNKTLQLAAGWNLIPVLSECEVDVFTLFEGTNLTIIKEVAGPLVYWPGFGINTLEVLETGKAYFVLMESDGEITFPDCNGKTGKIRSDEQLPVETPWDPISRTPITHVVAIDGKAISSLRSGDIIATFTSSGLCAGAIEYNGNPRALVINGDDALIEIADGFTENETIRYKLYRPTTNETFSLQVAYDPGLDHSGRFHAHGLTALTGILLTGVETPTSSGGREIHIYPNPSQGIFNIEGISGRVDIAVYNSFGENVLKGKLNLPGLIDLTRQPKGIYFIRITADDEIYYQKLVVD